MQVINTNVSSLNAQRQLAQSGNSLNTTLARLSSGLRINSAKDDAAGLAISERMTAQVRGLDQARRNANDGVSYMQTAEGALGQMGNILQRVRELAVQSANATNSAADRQTINAEVNQLVSELDRFAVQTEFNGRAILDGSSSSMAFQIGANANQTITATSNNFRTSAYGSHQLGNSATTTGTPTSWAGSGVTGVVVTANTVFTVQSAQGSGQVTGTATSSARSLAADLNALANTGVRAEAFTETTMTFGASGTFTLDVTGGGTTNTAAVAFTISSGNHANETGLSQVVNAFNAASASTGVSARLNELKTGVVLTSSTGENISFGGRAANTGVAVALGRAGDGGTSFSISANQASTVTAGGQLVLDSDKAFAFSANAGNLQAASFGAGNLGATPLAGTLQTVASLDVTSVRGATQALRIVDSAINSVNSQRANFGALQSRFDSTIAQLQTSSMNLSAARSRIRDTDFASETANLTRSQILQQAGTAMLAQANSLPNNVLSLLRG